MKILMIAYDNESFLTWFPQGLAYLAASCIENGHDVEIYQQDVYHWPESHLTSKLDNEAFDIVLISLIGGYYQHDKLMKISDAINSSTNRNKLKYLIGGHGPASDPEYYLKKTGAEFCGIGEGELTIIELLDAIKSKSELNKVNGIAYFDGDNVKITERRDLISNIDDIPMPAWHLFNMDYYSLLRLPGISNNERSFPILSGRGCTFECNFCFRLDKGFRPRSAKSILEEIKILIDKYNISYFAFSDELFMSSIERTIEICDAFIESGLKFKWDCNGRLNYAKPDVLNKMKLAGCVFINYGIESLDNNTLKIMNKALTFDIIEAGIKNTLQANISPGLNIIYGNINEPLEAIDSAVEFLLKYDDHAQLRTIRPVTPYPGSPLFEYALQNNLLNGTEDFYTNKHKNSDLLSVNFTKYKDEEIYEKLNWANKILISRHIEIQKENMMTLCDDLYLNKNDKFRGFRQT